MPRATKTSLKKCIRTASIFIALLPSRSVRQMLVAGAQALLFGRVKRVSRERASGRRSREGPRPLTRLASLAQIGELARRLNVGNVFLELNSKRLYRSWEKGKENRCLVFTSSMKRKIRKLHIVFVQWRQRNVQTSVMHLQSSVLF